MACQFWEGMRNELRFDLLVPVAISIRGLEAVGDGIAERKDPEGYR